MNAFTQFLNAEFVYALGWTILHSFWQCALVAVMLAVSFGFAKHLSSSTRYLMACSALVLCFAISLVTFKSYWDLAQQVRLESELNSLKFQIGQIFDTQRVVQNWLSVMDSYLIWIVVVWFVGCLLMSARNLLDFLICIRLKKQGAELASPHWEKTLLGLSDKVGVIREVSIRISSYLKSPCVLGHFKPVILVPAGMLSGLSQVQVELILLHELAHIRRNDYAIGLIQMLLKIIFFFNPMALWISSLIDAERESACDDIAVEVCKDPILFSKTLQEFAELNDSKKLAMSINDNRMHLLKRIKRQLQSGKSLSRAVEKLIASCTLLLCCVTVTVYAQTNTPAESKQLEEKIQTEMVKWPMFSKIPESQRLTAVKYYLEEYDAATFSAGITKTVSVASDKHPLEKVEASFFEHPLKVKLDISTDMLKLMHKRDSVGIANINLAVFKHGDNYVVAINTLSSAWADKTLDEKLRLVSEAFPKSGLRNKFFAKNNLEGYNKPFINTPADLTFKVDHEYLFVELSPTLIDYAINAPAAKLQDFNYERHKNYLVPGAPYAGAEKAANGNMIITYDRKSWEEKSEWFSKNGLYSNKGAKPQPEIQVTESKKELEKAIAKLDDRRKKLLLTDVQLQKIKACTQINSGMEVHGVFTYNLQNSWATYLAQMSEQQLIDTENSHLAHLKKFTMGESGKEFYVNLLDDSNNTPEDPEGLVSCKK